MQYLVTGGSGFIGSHLVEHLLKNGHSVINIDNFDDFYDYKIKIGNTLDSIGFSCDFSFKTKEEDIATLESLTKSDKYQLYYQDIRDLEGLERIFGNHKIDLVIHLAALAGVRPSIERPLDYEAVNIRGTMNLWELCKKHNIKKSSGSYDGPKWSGICINLIGRPRALRSQWAGFIVNGGSVWI